MVRALDKANAMLTLSSAV